MKARINDDLEVRSRTESAGIFMELSIFTVLMEEDSGAFLDFAEVERLRDACNEHLEECGRG
jgi:hypothetical protein